MLFAICLIEKMQKMLKSAVMDHLLDDTTTARPKLIKEGETVEGTVIAIHRKTLFVDLGGFKTGVVLGREFREATSSIKDLKPGDTVQATVVSLDDGDGYIELSMRAASRERAWDVLKRKMDEREILALRMKEANRGGLVIECEGIAGFMPVSQLSFAHYPRVEGGDKQKIFQELQKFVGQELKLRIIAVDPIENKLIFSEKAAENKELKEALDRYNVGDVVEGAISGIVNFGVFVRLDNNLEGLVHISELDWQLIEDPHDIVQVGDQVRAEVIGVESERISLSIKRHKPNPWDSVEEKYKVGDIVQGRIMKLNPFGAFAKLDKEIHGLAHVSEFGSEEKMREALTVGETYPFTILSLEPKQYKMALGFGKKKAEKEEKPEEKKE